MHHINKKSFQNLLKYFPLLTSSQKAYLISNNDTHDSLVAFSIATQNGFVGPTMVGISFPSSISNVTVTFGPASTAHLLTFEIFNKKE